MVTEVITRPTSPVLAVADPLGIPVQIRPWWGSVRSKREEWLCPGEYTSTLRWPEVEKGEVIMWEGPCHYQNHHHKQTLTVIDQDETAFLLEVRVSYNHTRFIIGMDDGHPYVAPVNRRPATVQDAFDWLVPNRIREALTLGKDVKRQGDWFFVPYDKEPRIYKGKPTKDDELWRSRPIVYRNYLNHNAFLHYGSQTQHKGELVVYKPLLGAPYPVPIVKGKVRAPDHPTLVLPTWHIGIRNRSTPAGNRDGRNED